ncbi:MAG: sensor histidine kinase [Candidatus Binatia bacterium]
MRKRLYLQIYLALVMALGLFALASSLVWWIAPRDRDADLFLAGMAGLVGESMPGADRPAEEQKAALENLASKFSADLTLLAADGSAVTSVGRSIATPRLPANGSDIVHATGRGMVAVLALPDGRKLLADHSGRRRHKPFGAILMIAMLAGLLALAALPVARRLTRRLERLRAGVDELGGGDLRARVGVEGRDEIADLARSFNRAAERIERLVHAQKEALATASHELRSPLARMRVAIELLGVDTRPDVRARIAADIDELDELIGEILLTSRLEASPVVERRDEVDLLALAAEEGARVGADVGGAAVAVRGDARLLRRLVRNLFENARRYGAGSAIEAEVFAGAEGSAVLRVSDRGPGIPPEERERVFEAFYRRAGTSEGEGGGVGLGLALVRRIATSHGGSARVLDRDGGGTTMEVTFARS